jgi:rhodanese-related sulfurtransferase
MVCPTPTNLPRRRRPRNALTARPAAALLAAALLTAALLTACTASEIMSPTPDWEALEQTIRQRFPDVVQLSTEELAAWLADPGREAPLLLDARAPEEYAVSHLDGARLAPGRAEALAALAGVPHTRPVVVYCSVGWRSSALADQLRREGFERVYNLEGSIFQWANEGRPVVRDGRPVAAVHPYDASWGRLLRRDLWTTEAP